MPVLTSVRRVLGATPLLARRAPRLRTWFGVAVLLASGAGLSACGNSGNGFAPACPQLALLRDAADLTTFRPGGRDLTDMVTDAKITAVPASCMPGGRGVVKAEMRVTMQISRGPAAQGRTAMVPYFVAITDGDQVLDEQDYRIAAAFPTNVDTITVTGQPITLDIPVTPTKSAAAYKIYVGYRLSPDELDYNRRRGSR